MRSDSHDTLAVDIGGANLKFVRSIDHHAVEMVFPLWKTPDSLADALADGFRSLGNASRLVVTMTGELADCFADRGDGVRHIVDHTRRAATACQIAELSFYGTDGRFHSSNYAAKHPDVVAAANWHALASAVGQSLAAEGLLVDIGSTTTDIIPIRGGKVATRAKTDHERLAEGSLVYIGCRRTPICALVNHFNIGGQNVPIMNEVFATIDDARICRGDQAEVADDCETADGRPRTIVRSRARLARMVGLDGDELGDEDVSRIADQVVDAASGRITAAAVNGLGSWGAELGGSSPRPRIVLSGHGQSLVNDTAGFASFDLAERLGPAVSRAAPCWAIAWLAEREIDNSPCL